MPDLTTTRAIIRSIRREAFIDPGDLMLLPAGVIAVEHVGRFPAQPGEKPAASGEYRSLCRTIFLPCSLGLDRLKSSNARRMSR